MPYGMNRDKQYKDSMLFFIIGVLGLLITIIMTIAN